MVSAASAVPVRSFPTTWSTPVTTAATTVDDCATGSTEEMSDENSWKSPFREYEKRRTRQSTLLIGRNINSGLGEYDLKENILGMRKSAKVQGVPKNHHRSPILTWKTRALSGGDRVPKTPKDILTVHKDTSTRKIPTPHSNAKPHLGRSFSAKSPNQGGVSNSEQIRQLALLVKRRLSLGGEASIDRPLSAVNFFEREKPTRLQAAHLATSSPESSCSTSKNCKTSVSTASARHASFSVSRNEARSQTETFRCRLMLDDSSAVASRRKRQRPATAQGNVQLPTSNGAGCTLNDVGLGPQKRISKTGKSRDLGYDRFRRPRATGPTLSGCQVTVQPKEMSTPRKFTGIPGVLPKEEQILMEFDPESLESLLGLSEIEDKQLDGCAYVTSPNPEFFGQGDSHISVGGTGASMSEVENTRDVALSANRPPRSKASTPKPKGGGRKKRCSSGHDLFDGGGSQKSRPASRNAKGRQGGGTRTGSADEEVGTMFRSPWCVGSSKDAPHRPQTAVARLEGIPPRPGSAAQAVYLNGQAWDKGYFPELMDGLEKAPLCGWETVGSSDLTPRH